MNDKNAAVSTTFSASASNTLFGVAILLLAWLLLSSTSVIPETIIAPPWKAAQAILDYQTNGIASHDLTRTACRSMLAFGFACLVGIPTGILIGVLPRVRRLALGPIDALRSLPALALYPLILRLVGPNDSGIVVLAGITTCLVILVHTVGGVTQGRQSRRKAAWLMGASRIMLIREVVLPEALPHLLSGCRIGWTITVVLVVVSEVFFCRQDGLGAALITYHANLQADKQWAAVVCVAALGLAGSVLIQFIEDKRVHWQGR